jgi:hypothetical protein
LGAFAPLLVVAAATIFSSRCAICEGLRHIELLRQCRKLQTVRNKSQCVHVTT